jgi:hypothetical protein
VGGQWVPGWRFKNWDEGQKFKYDLMIVNNDTDPSIGTQQKLMPLPEAKAGKSAAGNAVQELVFRSTNLNIVAIFSSSGWIWTASTAAALTLLGTGVV